MNKGCALHAVKSLASPLRTSSALRPREKFYPCAGFSERIKIRFLLFGVKVCSARRFAPGMVLIFFSLLRRFFLDIDVS